MTTQELVNMIIPESGDILDEEEDNIPYINHAIDLLSFFLADEPALISVATVKDKDDVPDNFQRLVPPNGYPVRIEGKKFRIISSDRKVTIHYSTHMPHVSSMDDVIPFADMYASCLVLIASYMIKKRIFLFSDYVQEDSAFVQQLMAAIKQAQGGEQK